MSASPSDPSTDTQSQITRNSVQDLQGLLLHLQASQPSLTTSTVEHDIIVDKLMLIAIHMIYHDRDLRFKCLQLAYLFERPALNVSEQTKLIQTKWNEMERQVQSVRVKLLTLPRNEKDTSLLRMIDGIISSITQYINRNMPSVSKTPHIQSHGTQPQHVYPQHVQRQPKTYTQYIPWVPNTDRRPAAVHQNPHGSYYQVSNKLASQERTSDLADSVGQVRPCRCEGCPGCDGTPDNCRCIGKCRCVHDV